MKPGPAAASRSARERPDPESRARPRAAERRRVAREPGDGSAAVGPGGRAATGTSRHPPSLRLVAPRARAVPAPGTEPLLVPSSTFETRRLVRTGDARLELRRTSQERALAAVFAVLGAGVIAVGVERLGVDAPGPAVWLPPLAGLAMILAAVLLHRSGGHVVIDGRAGEFRRTGGALPVPNRPPVRVPFTEVAAVQRLTCRFADEEASWTVHQINLVRADGSRVHVCSHVDDTIARDGAARIARLIGVEVLAWPEGPEPGGLRSG